MSPQRAMVRELAGVLRDVVVPRLGRPEGRAHGATGAGGDVTFAIDAEAEALLEGWVRAHAPATAFYSEDRGLVRPDGDAADWVLVVDPIDGTRPALAGFEAACTAVAVAPLGSGNPRMGDVVAGCVVEIKSGGWFLAGRGEGCAASVPLAPSDNADLDRLFWAHGFRGRPARPHVTVLGDLIDRSSVGGGVFELGSAAFAMTRVLTGQLDAYVEPGSRMIDEVDGMREAFERVGGGQVLNNSPYDLAAAALCLSEGGAVVTDCRGDSLDPRPLLGSGHEFQMSMLACGSPGLHAKLLAEIDAGIGRLRTGDPVRAQ